MPGFGRCRGAPEPAADKGHHVRARHGSSGDECAGRGGHHRRHRCRQHQPAKAYGQHAQRDVGIHIILGLNTRQDDAGRHTDHGARHTVEHAIESGDSTAPACNARRTGREHPLPDVLPDKKPQRVHNEVGDDGLHADAGDAEELGRCARGDTGKAAGGVEREGQHQEKYAHGLDDELRHVSERDRPHATHGGVDQYDGAAHGNGRGTIPAEKHHEDGGVGAG